MSTTLTRSYDSATPPVIPTRTTPVAVTVPAAAADRPTGAERSLVVLDPTDPSTTLQAALQQRTPRDGAVDLLVVFPTATYEARRQARLAAGVTAPYTIDHLEAEAHRIAQRTGHEYLDSTGIAYEPIGAVGRLQDAVRTAHTAHGYTHVYVDATPRSLLARLLGTEDTSSTLAAVVPGLLTVLTKPTLAADADSPTLN